MRGSITPARSKLGKEGKAWTLVVNLGDDEDGKRQQKSCVFEGTRREAERELTRLQSEADKHKLSASTGKTVAKYLGEWLDAYTRSRLQGQSPRTYTYCVNRLSAAVGTTRLDRLTPGQVQKAIDAILAEGGSPATARLCLAVAHRAFERAVKLRVLAVNPCDGVDAPAVPHFERLTPDRDQCMKLLAATPGVPMGLAAVLALGTGMRIGEVSAAAWANTDLASGVLRITHSRLPDGTLKAPKSGKARSLFLPEFCILALKEEKARQDQIRQRIPGWNADGWIVCTPEGLPMDPTHGHRIMARLCTAAKVPAFCYHSLRHAHASLLLQDGENLKTVQERLGHSSPTITLNVYAHILPGAQEGAARRVNGLLGRS